MHHWLSVCDVHAGLAKMSVQQVAIIRRHAQWVMFFSCIDACLLALHERCFMLCSVFFFECLLLCASSEGWTSKGNGLCEAPSGQEQRCGRIYDFEAVSFAHLAFFSAAFALCSEIVFRICSLLSLRCLLRLMMRPRTPSPTLVVSIGHARPAAAART